MVLATIALAASLGMSPTAHANSSFHSASVAVTAEKPNSTTRLIERQDLAVDLHPMTEQEKRMYPGRENWDKTEWYEAQFKSAKIVIMPEHVDEWHNGGIDLA